MEVFAKPGRDACGRPEVPLLATVEVDGTIATYSCTEEGLVMEGSARLTCQGGEWQGDPPTCRERVCPSPRPASGGYIEVPEFRGSYTRGLTAIYRLVVKSCPILITNPRCFIVFVGMIFCPSNQDSLSLEFISHILVFSSWILRPTSLTRTFLFLMAA